MSENGIENAVPEGTPGREQFATDTDTSWQPEKEEALLDTPAEDVLDEGLTAPETDPLAGLDLTPSGQAAGEDLDDRLAREEPEVWEKQPDPEAAQQVATGLAGEQGPHDETSVGRLTGTDDELTAEDAGHAGGVPAPEEIAVVLEDESGAVDEGGSPEPE